MRTDDGSAPDLLRQMGRLVVPVVTPEQEATRQQHVAASVDHLLAKLAQQPEPRFGKWAQRALGIAAAAAVSGLAFGAFQHYAHSPGDLGPEIVALGGEASVWQSEQSEPTAASAGLKLSSGARLHTDRRSTLSLKLRDAALVDVAAQTRIRVQELSRENSTDDERVELAMGHVLLKVPKLSAGHTLSVTTPDARVTVRGTRFSVDVVPGKNVDTVTSVQVTEGRVEVESRGRTLFLTPGEEWSSAPEAPAADTSPPATPTTPDSGRASEITAPGEPPATKGSALRPNTKRAKSAAQVSADDDPESTLAQENAIYAGALARARAGDVNRALVDLEALQRDFPRSPLVQNARVEHFRLLHESGNKARAAREARRYLSDYPNGFARAEARRIALVDLEDAE